MTIVNGQSEYIRLNRETTKVYVYYTGGAAGTLTPSVSKRQGELIPIEVDGAATITGSVAFIVEGEGLLSFSASGVSGSITVEIE